MVVNQKSRSQYLIQDTYSASEGACRPFRNRENATNFELGAIAFTGIPSNFLIVTLRPVFPMASIGNAECDEAQGQESDGGRHGCV